MFRGAAHYVKRKIRWRKIVRGVARGGIADLSEEDIAQISTEEFFKFPLAIKLAIS